MNSLPLSGEKHPNLGDALARHLGSDAFRLVQRIAEEAEGQGLRSYLVGGIVRDLLLGRESLDIDLVLEGAAIPFARGLRKKFGGALEQHKRFGTAKWLLDPDRLKQELGIEGDGLPGHVDLISAREERYPRAGDLPQVEFEDIRADTQRRDFTINTLALRLDGAHWGELLDIWGGVEDLREGRLRLLQKRSFRDDATRLLRLYRFKHRFGFELEAQTESLVVAGLPYLASISGERLRHELDLILGEEQALAILRDLDQRGVLSAISPILGLDSAAEQALKSAMGGSLGAQWKLEGLPQAWLSMCAWLVNLEGGEDEVGKLLERLALERELSRAAVKARAALAEVGSWDTLKDSQIAAALDEMPALGLAALFFGLEGEAQSKVAQYVASWRDMQPQASGEDLKALGLAEGPAYAQILARLRAAWVDAELHTEAEERALLERLVREAKS